MFSVSTSFYWHCENQSNVPSTIRCQKTSNKAHFFAFARAGFFLREELSSESESNSSSSTAFFFEAFLLDASPELPSYAAYSEESVWYVVITTWARLSGRGSIGSHSVIEVRRRVLMLTRSTSRTEMFNDGGAGGHFLNFGGPLSTDCQWADHP